MFTYGGIAPGIVAPPATMVSIANAVCSDVRTEPPNAVADYELLANGQARTFKGNGGYTNLPGEWRVTGASADYEVRFTTASGDAPNRGSALGVWLNLGSTRSVGQLNTVAGTTRTGTVTVEIRDVATSTIRDTATITLTAIKNSIA